GITTATALSTHFWGRTLLSSARRDHEKERTRMAASLKQDADLRISDVRRTTRTNPVSPLDNLDLICLSHLRWNFVYQRPQHLLSRAGSERRIFFVEEPVVGGDDARLDLRD